MPTEDRGGPNGGPLRSKTGPDMRDDQPPYAGAPSNATGVLRRQMHLPAPFAFAMRVDVGLTQEQIRVPGEFTERGTGPTAPGVRENPPTDLGPQPIRRGRTPGSAPPG